MEKRVLQAIKIDDKVYAPGVHHFTEKVMKHPHFAFYVKAGRIVPLKETVKGMAKAEEALAQRKEIEEKLGVPSAKAPAPSVAEEESPVASKKKGKK